MKNYKLSKHSPGGPKDWWIKYENKHKSLSKVAFNKFYNIKSLPGGPEIKKISLNKMHFLLN